MRLEEPAQHAFWGLKVSFSRRTCESRHQIEIWGRATVDERGHEGDAAAEVGGDETGSRQRTQQVDSNMPSAPPNSPLKAASGVSPVMTVMPCAALSRTVPEARSAWRIQPSGRTGS